MREMHINFHTNLYIQELSVFQLDIVNKKYFTLQAVGVDLHFFYQ